MCLYLYANLDARSHSSQASTYKSFRGLRVLHVPSVYETRCTDETPKNIRRHSKLRKKCFLFQSLSVQIWCDHQSSKYYSFEKLVPFVTHTFGFWRTSFLISFRIIIWVSNKVIAKKQPKNMFERCVIIQCSKFWFIYFCWIGKWLIFIQLVISYCWIQFAVVRSSNNNKWNMFRTLLSLKLRIYFEIWSSGISFLRINIQWALKQWATVKIFPSIRSVHDIYNR